ncbi:MULTISPECIES: hypothetical protein [unclassified Haloarcula]|uniref:hypothetical protein n=1 Tax=unclassified Haloarcula TaxID=2624677 RepID=UPI001244B4E2|nr:MULTISPECIES: hypothetical protein [unclassified Haloarcula]
MQFHRSYVTLFAGKELLANSREVWLPLAETVSSGGDLYVSAWDNKPPLFQFANIGVYETGHYAASWFVLIAIANAITAILIYRYGNKRGEKAVGLIAAIFFLAAFPYIGGTKIDPRPLSNMLMVAALLVSRPVLIGLLIAGAGLFSQFAMFALPAVLFDRHQLTNLTWKDLVTVSVAGLATAALSYLSVAVIWGLDAAITGVRYTMFAADGYVNRYVERERSIVSNPIWWFYRIELIGRYIMFVLAPAFAGAWIYAWRGFSAPLKQIVEVSLLGTVLLALPLLIRPAPVYWSSITPFASLLAASAVVHGVRSLSDDFPKVGE